jgi:hypothetical protein
MHLFNAFQTLWTARVEECASLRRIARLGNTGEQKRRLK